MQVNLRIYIINIMSKLYKKLIGNNPTNGGYSLQRAIVGISGEETIGWRIGIWHKLEKEDRTFSQS